MMSRVLRKSCPLWSRRTLTAALTSIDALVNHHVETAAIASVGRRGSIGTGATGHGEIRPFCGSSNLFGIKVRDFHVKSGPSDFRAPSLSQAEFAVQGYDSAYGNTNGSSEGIDSVRGDEGLEISSLGISPEITKALSSRGITKLFPIQKAVLEPAMQGRDMIARARTGTGKTLAFGIPVIDSIIKFNAKHGRGKNPLCLVLAPTRELARQVEKEFHESAPSLDTICLYGGTPIGRQMSQLDYGVDIAVGTPGRIIDLMKRGALNLSEVQFVVLDEADQMLQVGFAEDVEVILGKLPKERQSMMFSATMPSWIRSLTQKYMKDPLTIDLVGNSDQKLADGISIFAIASDSYGKASVIGPLVAEHAKGGKCIVFTQTKRDADRLAYAMARTYRCEALHGDISQSQRERTLAGFRDGHFNILVATDVAARGLDIPNVDLVIHYELPNSSETFVHRTGRTGRAGKKGTAIAIYTQDQARSIKLIEREVGCRFTELPRIVVERGSSDAFIDMSPGPRSGGFGGMRDRRSGDSGFGRFGGQSDFRGGGRFSGSGRSGGYGGSDRSGGYGGSDRSGGYGRSDQSGGYGGSDRFGSNTNRSGGSGFGRSDRSSGFGNFGSSQSSGFGDFGSSWSGGSSGGFGDFGSSQSGGFGNSGSGRFGKSFGDGNNGGRKSF